MLIHDDIFHWDGWGGKLRLASGKCRLRIFDLTQDAGQGLTVLRPVIVVVSDIGKQDVSVRSCAGHIATMVTEKFDIDPHRMLWIEYYPATQYGMEANIRVIPERFDAVEFIWHDGRAVQPKWRTLKQPLLDTLKRLVAAT